MCSIKFKDCLRKIQSYFLKGDLMMLPMLLLTINCSISDKKNHLKLDELLDLINHFDSKKAKLSPIQKYAIGIMKTEADSNEIKRFIQDYHITQKDMDSVLSFEPYAN